MKRQNEKSFTSTIPTIKQLVEEETGYDLLNPRQTRDRVYIRSVYFKLCRNNTLSSYNKIGKSVKKNHATVMHGINLYDETLCRFEKAYVELYKKIEFKLRNKNIDIVLEIQDIQNKIKDLQTRLDHILQQL
tara:strand:- start:28589 stop:28984 length:396 start_codon:yes stop_codon:yes gene_type:complete